MSSLTSSDPSRCSEVSAVIRRFERGLSRVRRSYRLVAKYDEILDKRLRKVSRPKTPEVVYQ